MPDVDRLLGRLRPPASAAVAVRLLPHRDVRGAVGGEGVWFQSAHRSRSARPASLAIRSSSEGHTKRCGDWNVRAAPSSIQ
jgi:hypothetical protein